MGAKKVIVLGLFICGIGEVTFGLMPSYEWLVFSRILLGAGVGLLFVAPYSMVVRWFEQSKKLGVGLGIMFATDGVAPL